MDSIVDWIKNHNGVAIHDGTDIYITTLEGVMKAVVGDWVIKGVNNEFYPCKPDIFAKTYEEADKGGKLEKVMAVKDNDSHWYVIPSALYAEFAARLNQIYGAGEDTPEAQSLHEEFDEVFGDYRTGGGLNNKQLYAEL